MDTRKQGLETGCELVLVALVVVACFAGIPPILDAVTQAIAQSRIDAAPIKFACRSCGVVDAVREVTLGEENQNSSTISGERFAMFFALLTSELAAGPVNVLEVSVLLQDGSVRVFHEGMASAWKPGDRVKVGMGRIKPLS